MMIKSLPLLIALQIACLSAAAISSAADKPAWIQKRPISPDYYVGIGMAEKASEKVDYRQKAKSDALLDLAQEISVAVSGSYIEKIVEKTGLSEQTIRSELQTSSKARIQGHELVDQWEDRNAYWVYYRLSKQQYARLLDKSRSAAIRMATDMHNRALKAAENHQIVSALRFDHEALQQISPFMGDAVGIQPAGNDQPLGNAIYAHLQQLLSAIQIVPSKPEFPVLAGNATPVEMSVAAAYARKGKDPISVAHLPLDFEFPWRSENSVITKFTDPEGRANCGIGAATAAQDGLNVDIAVNTAALFPSDDLIAKALLARLNRPRTAIRLQVFHDREEYVWHQEFQNRKVAILAAYQVDGASHYWPKFSDELMQFLKGAGARTALSTINLPAEKIISLSEQAERFPPIPALADTEIVIVLAAKGIKNQRDNPKNKFGGDVQFAGEFRTIVQRKNRITFSDRYQAMSGWNPLGIQMCMDVSALHALKRWKKRYRAHLYQY